MQPPNMSDPENKTVEISTGTNRYLMSFYSINFHIWIRPNLCV